jgi:hypothetical protein
MHSKTKFSMTIARVALALAIVLPAQARAVELAGAWAGDADQCKKIFARKGRVGRIEFAPFSGIYGGGFIIEADRLRGKHASCEIKNRKVDGETVNLIAACATDIMLSHVQFVLKIKDDDTMTRVFPGLDGIETSYHRCKF